MHRDFELLSPLYPLSRWLADAELRSGLPLALDLRPRPPCVQDGSQRYAAHHAIELESTGIKVNAACPGFTKTNLNNYSDTQTVEEGARELVRLALLGPDGPTGISPTRTTLSPGDVVASG